MAINIFEPFRKVMRKIKYVIKAEINLSRIERKTKFNFLINI